MHSFRPNQNGTPDRLAGINCCPVIQVWLTLTNKEESSFQLSTVYSPGADQLLPGRRGADFPGGVHWCVTKEAARVPIF